MRLPIRSNVLQMRPYPPGRPIEEVQRELGLTDIVKLASNENPIGPSPLAVEAVKRAAESSNFYPDAAGFALKQRIAEIHSVPVDMVMLGSGSDEIITLLGTMCLEPGTELVMADPSFLRYDAAAHLNGARLVKVPVTSKWVHDLDAMADVVNERTRLVFVANPNNPTGTIVDLRALEKFLARLPESVLVVLDEAYFEFARSLSTDYPDGLNLVKEDRPVVALRTFSKAYGLAGLRVGYGFAHPEVVRAFNAARSPFDVNSLAQAAALAALEDSGHLDRTLQNNREGLAQIAEAMKSAGFATIPSFANFVCVDVRGPSRPVFEALQRQGVIVRPGDQLGMPNYLRVSVGTRGQNQRFIDALTTVMAVSRQA